MTEFKDRLWRELVREHGAELAEMQSPAGRGAHRRPRVLAGTTAGLAGLGTVLAVALSAAGTSPAFAVSRNHDGTWSVSVTTYSAIPLANARLAALDVRARLVAVAAGCDAKVPPKVWAERAQAIGHGVRFDAGKIPAGKTLMLAAFPGKRGLRVTAAHLVRGEAPVCLPPMVVPCLIGKQAFSVTSYPAAPSAGVIGNSGAPVTALRAISSTMRHYDAALMRARRAAAERGPITERGQVVAAGRAGLSCRVWQVAALPPRSTGYTGNSGSTGNSGATTGNSGSTGNSGATTSNSGSTGNSGGS